MRSSNTLVVTIRRNLWLLIFILRVLPCWSLRGRCSHGFLLVVALGCSGARDLDLDPDVAASRSTGHSRRGSTARSRPTCSLRSSSATTSGSPGKKLLSYEIKSNEMSDGNNLHLFVVCQFANPKGKKPIKTEVTYIVGTDPVITIFPQ